MSDKTAIQNEMYWRARIAEEIYAYSDETHPPHGRNACPRCDIAAVLELVGWKVQEGWPT